MSSEQPSIGSCLDFLSAQQVTNHPYPHIASDNVLDNALYQKLASSFPAIEQMKHYRGFEGIRWGEEEFLARHKSLSNLRMDISALDVQKSELDSVWKQFVTRHLTHSHFNQFVSLFETSIQQLYPKLLEKLKSPNLKIGQVHVNTFDDHDVLLNANISMNSPVLEKPSRVRGPHLDVSTQLFAGLLYFRDENDDSEGGQFTLYKKVTAPRFSNNEIFDDCVKPVIYVPYNTNNIALFLNTENSIHGVTPRSVTANTRKFFIFGAYVKNSLFDISPYQS